jgi:transposase
MEAAFELEKITDFEALRIVARNAIEKVQTSNERIRELETKLLLKEERIAELLRERWSRTSEKLAAGESNRHPELFDEIETIAREDRLTEDHATITIAAHIRKRGKRAKLPENLPRIETVIDIDEAEKVCGCGSTLVKIGEDVSEKLEVIPARFVVRRTIRPRYACSSCGGAENEPERPVVVAPVPPSILPKTNATPSLLATIATWKFQDALPLHRQERIFARHGIELGRATMSRWMLELASRCSPVIDAIERHIRSGPMIGMDETPTQVLGESGRASTSVSYMWLARGGPEGKLAVRFMYKPTRAANVPTEFLAGYTGVLQTDGLAVYDSALKADGCADIVHVGCMTHARRRFIQADRSGKIPTSAKTALNYFKLLYALEKQAKDLNLDDTSRLLLRREKAVPILTEFKLWLDQRVGEVPPESLIVTVS